jgi:hypothetical protein
MLREEGVKLRRWQRNFFRGKEGTYLLGFLLRQPQVISWDRLAQSFQQQPHYLDAFLGALKKQTHVSLIERWGGLPEKGHVLKTDLFEEAMGTDALLEELASRQGLTVGMDVAVTIADHAREKSKQSTAVHICRRASPAVCRCFVCPDCFSFDA